MDTPQYSKGTLLVSEAAGGGLPFPQYPADTQVLKEPALVSEAKAFHFRHRHCLSQSLPNRVVTLNGPQVRMAMTVLGASELGENV